MKMTDFEKIERTKAFLKAWIEEKPKKKPEWGTDMGGNYDDCETNGYNICAWHHAEQAELLLREIEDTSDQ